ncbi:MAG: BadF/BadG/BcrA/BcrD ATPase family protein [bacterium]
MNLYLGIDGGQTKTVAVIGNEDGEVLGWGMGGPSNHIREKGGKKRFREALLCSVREAMEDGGLEDVIFRSAYLGISGACDEMLRIARKVIKAERIFLEGDALLALASCTLGKEGAVIIAGGGSVAFGKNKEGEFASAGGWGYFMGDEGSAFWIAKEGINRATKAVDGRGKQTLILPKLLSHFNLPNLQELHRLIYSGKIGRPEIARAAEAVLQAAQEGDEVALEICQRAGEELAEACIAVLRKLSMDKEEVIVGLFGGVFSSGEVIIKPLRERLLQEVPNAKLTFPILPPEGTALLLAIQRSGKEITSEIIERIKETLERRRERSFG